MNMLMTDDKCIETLVSDNNKHSTYSSCIRMYTT